MKIFSNNNKFLTRYIFMNIHQNLEEKKWWMWAHDITLYPHKSKFHLYSHKSLKTQINQNENLRLACSGAMNYFVNLGNHLNTIIVTCFSADYFYYGSTILNFYESFSCKKVSMKSFQIIIIRFFNHFFHDLFHILNRYQKVQ